jgi:sensor histidine kinase YesM
MTRLFQYKLDHLLFWILTVFFHAYTRTDLISQAGWVHFWMEVIIRNLLLALVIYLGLRFIFPEFLVRKKYFTAIALSVLTLAFYVMAKNLHDVYLFGFVLGNEDRKIFFPNTLYNFSIVVFYVTFATALHLSKQWYLQREKIRKIELEKLNTELEYLKAQINPHFLFNSINTIFFQIDKQNTAARETLTKFSDMLRYQLYECNGKEIAVENEIRYLKNYVGLQRLRKDEQYDIVFSVSEDLNGFSVPPLLLIPFIENAFKHVSHFTDRKNEIKITLSKKDHTFQMRVFNTLDKTKETDREGIGLKNVKRRLELLYQDQYQLNLAKNQESFEVDLELQIASFNG